MKTRKCDVCGKEPALRVTTGDAKISSIDLCHRHTKVLLYLVLSRIRRYAGAKIYREDDDDCDVMYPIDTDDDIHEIITSVLSLKDSYSKEGSVDTDESD